MKLVAQMAVQIIGEINLLTSDTIVYHWDSPTYYSKNIQLLHESEWLFRTTFPQARQRTMNCNGIEFLKENASSRQNIFQTQSEQFSSAAL